MADKIQSPNLISQVKPEALVRQPGVYKPIIFDALSVCLAYVSGWAYSGYLSGSISVAILVGVLGLFAVLSALQVFFAKSLTRRFGILILETVVMLFPFYQYDLRILGAAAGVMIVWRFWGEMIGRGELENGLEIKFFKAANPALKKLTTAIVAAFLILYLPQLSRENIFISKINFQNFFDWTAGAVKNFYPEINFNSSFNKMAEDIARLELQGNIAFNSLSPQNREPVVKQVAAQIAEGLEKSIGQKISPDESVSKVFYDFLIETLTRWKDRLQNWFLFGWAIAVFAVIRGFGFIFYRLVGLVAFLLYQILLSFGFIYVGAESRTHEVIGF